MPRYKFDEIAVNSTAKKKPTEADMETYIGLEHLDAGSLTVERFGSKVPIKGEKLAMTKGDVLFGRRNTYLRRAAIAPHDGLFSAHGMVLRPKTDVIAKEFFPIFIASDYFFDEAIRISVGSISPTVNWGQLKDLEFDLPPLDAQRTLAEVLWAMIEAKNAYKRLISLTDDLVKSRFVEMFESKGYPVKRLDEIADTRLGKMLDAKKQTGKCTYRYLANFNVQWFSFDLTKLNQMDFDEADREEFSLRNGDMLVCEGGEVGRTAIWREEIEDCYFQKALHRVRCRPTECVPEYLAYAFYHKAMTTHFDGFVTSATIAHLTGEKLRALQFIVPPLALQNEFAAFAEAADKSKFVAWEATKITVETVKILQKTLCRRSIQAVHTRGKKNVQ